MQPASNFPDFMPAKGTDTAPGTSTTHRPRIAHRIVRISNQGVHTLCGKVFTSGHPVFRRRKAHTEWIRCHHCETLHTLNTELENGDN